jgi:hypothetical protein
MHGQTCGGNNQCVECSGTYQCPNDYGCVEGECVWIGVPS